MPDTAVPLAPSSTEAALGNELFLFSPRWQGARVAKVTGLTVATPPTDVEGKVLPKLANVRVTLDLVHDHEMIRRSVPASGAQGSGSAMERYFSHVRVYDTLTPKQRLQAGTAADPRHGVWAEWPPTSRKTKP